MSHHPLTSSVGDFGSVAIFKMNEIKCYIVISYLGVFTLSLSIESLDCMLSVNENISCHS